MPDDAQQARDARKMYIRALPPKELVKELSGDIVEYLTTADDVDDLTIRGQLAGEMNRLFETAAKHVRRTRRDAIAELLMDGVGVTQISRTVGVSDSTVKKVREALPPPDPGSR